MLAIVDVSLAALELPLLALLCRAPSGFAYFRACAGRFAQNEN